MSAICYGKEGPTFFFLFESSQLLLGQQLSGVNFSTGLTLSGLLVCFSIPWMSYCTLPLLRHQVGITLRNASKDAQPLPIMTLEALDSSEGGGLVWKSYDTGLVEGPFRPEHIYVLSLTHSLAVTGKVLVAALEEFPSFSKSLQYLKVGVLGFRGCRGVRQPAMSVGIMPIQCKRWALCVARCVCGTVCIGNIRRLPRTFHVILFGPPAPPG